MLGEFFVVRRLLLSGVGPSVALEVCCDPVPDKPHIPPDVLGSRPDCRGISAIIVRIPRQSPDSVPW